MHSNCCTNNFDPRTSANIIFIASELGDTNSPVAFDTFDDGAVVVFTVVPSVDTVDVVVVVATTSGSIVDIGVSTVVDVATVIVSLESLDISFWFDLIVVDWRMDAFLVGMMLFLPLFFVKLLEFS